MMLFAAAALAALSALAYLLARDALFPPVILAAVWSFALATAWTVSSETNYPLSTVTLWLVTIGAGLFFTGAFVTSRVGSQKYRRRGVEARVARVPTQAQVLVLVGMAGLILPFYVRAAFALAADGPTEVWYINLRYGVTYGGGIGWPSYGLTFAYIALVAVQIRRLEIRDRTSRRLLAAALGVLTIYVVLATSRTSVLQAVAMFFGPALFIGRIKIGRNVPIALVSTVAVFTTFAIVLNKGVEVGGGAAAVLVQAVESIKIYIVGGLFGLDHIVRTPVDSPFGTNTPFGANTLRFFYAAGARLGFDVPVVDLIQEYVTTPITSNVYTFYYPYIVDVGVDAAAVAQGGLGLLYGTIYRRARQRVASATVLFIASVSMYPLVMQFFHDQYVSLLSTWIQYALIWLVVVRPFRFVRRTGRRRASRPHVIRHRPLLSQ